MKLVIGNKTYSSWSLRPWLLMKHFEMPFEEILIKLDLPNTREEILKYSPAARVPILIDGDLHIWDSLAIMEYLNEKFPDKKMYPINPKLRARARSLSAEMHSGFAKMRELLSFHAKKRFLDFDYSQANDDIQRVLEIWEEQLKISGGPFLFSDFSIADAMYAPVAGRFQTYGVKCTGRAKEYCEMILALPAMKFWYDGARKEEFIAPLHE